MSINAAVTHYHANDGETDGINTSLGVIGAGFTVTGIDLYGEISPQPFTITSGSSFIFGAAFVAGLQYGASGYTPTNVVSDPTASNWLINRHVLPSASIAVYPSGAGSFYTDRYQLRLRWRGQLPISANTQFYYSDGAIATVPDWERWFTATIWYA